MPSLWRRIAGDPRETERTKDWAERASIMEPDDFYLNYNLARLCGAGRDRTCSTASSRSCLKSAQVAKEFMLHDSDSTSCAIIRASSR
jgi:hypothetical protein